MKGLTAKDCALAALLCAAPVAVFAAIFLSGRTIFWGDLTYLHHPWRALEAQMQQRGELPLWDPYAYLGMPLAAQMQGGVWYPASAPFFIWGFPAALALFLGIHYGLAGFFSYLWLRREGFARAAAWAGAAAFMGNGVLLSRAPFINHLCVLAYVPAFLLFRRRARLLAPALALAFAAGYPPILAGGAAAAFVLSRLAGADRPRLGAWAAAAGAAAALGACLLLPAVDLAAGSQRGAGLGLADTLKFGFAPKDLIQFVSPLLAGAGGFSAPLFWWKTCYFGIFAWAAALLAFPRLKGAVAAGFAVYIGLACLVLLGAAASPSLWLWSRFPPLRYIRYPGNLSYLVVPALSFLAACGLQGRRWASLFSAALTLELAAYAWGSTPLVDRGFFADAGPLVRDLQSEAGGHRYLLSPLALEWQRGFGRDFASASLDLKHRLYGVTNIPYRLPAAAGFGEPLVPRASYGFMDFLYGLPGIDAAAPYLPWADVRFLMTRERRPSRLLKYSGRSLWETYEAPESSRALWFSDKDGAALPAALVRGAPVPDIRKGRPALLERSREDRFSVKGDTSAGWLYVAEPRVSGWRAWLDGRPAATEPAMGPFQKLRVPAGAWEIVFRYEPSPWRVGLAVTLASLAAFASLGYRKLAAFPLSK